MGERAVVEALSAIWGERDTDAKGAQGIVVTAEAECAHALMEISPEVLRFEGESAFEGGLGLGEVARG